MLVIFVAIVSLSVLPLQVTHQHGARIVFVYVCCTPEADRSGHCVDLVAYLAVQNGSTSLMNTVVTQCGLQRAVLKGGSDDWQHIIGPQSQDTGLWSTGNGWAAYGMVRVLHTLQKWSGSSGSMTSQAVSVQQYLEPLLSQRRDLDNE
jgi:hypothetical protein